MSHDKTPMMQTLQADSYLFSSNAAYLEEMYERYLQNPHTCPQPWKNYFSQLANGSIDPLHSQIRQQLVHLVQQPLTRSPVSSLVGNASEKQAFQVAHLIAAYRSYGHFQADLDPLNLAKKPNNYLLQPENYGLASNVLEQSFALNAALGLQTASLNTILSEAHRIYCGKIGFEYQHISNQEQREWLSNQIENRPTVWNLTPEEKKRILHHLIRADKLEKYLGAKFVAQKRFSLEGHDSLLPLLDTLIQHARRLDTEEIILGMAHRGRLNVLVNIFGKPFDQLSKEFQGKFTPNEGSGDVKYHKGFYTELSTDYGSIQLTMAFNPSHLEAINPIVPGMARARQDRRLDCPRYQVLPVLLHGDASFSGQGIVIEALQLCRTSGYTASGTVHIVLNNQVGFTANPEEAHSSWYCTDVAKSIEAPVFHVNADDPEAVVWVTQLALKFRTRFQTDVVIDLVGYRRHGHNEADEPSVTQPIMYQVIKHRPSLQKIYADCLIKQGTIDSSTIRAFEADYQQLLDLDQNPIVSNRQAFRNPCFQEEKDQVPIQDWRFSISNGLTTERLQQLGNRMLNLPETITLQSQVAKILTNRRKMVQSELAMDWGCAEMLAYASLLQDHFSVRLSGQDSARGTFFHRHAVLHDSNSGQIHVPLVSLAQTGHHFTILNSPLSEAGVMAFEYGYACAHPTALVIWEAQYGDFVNGAQVIIDQFLSSSEEKWRQLCGLVLFLPHGHEGAGPEHSSARLERFLQLCAQNNMQVCIPTTPAQIFHLLRRQVLRPYQKPLVVMTPKSILRHPLATSSLTELASESFQPIIKEIDYLPHASNNRIILCSGKVYYDLLEQRRLLQNNLVPIIRLEQLYPFPDIELKTLLSAYTTLKNVIWCQEEPENQGAWSYIQGPLKSCLSSGISLDYCGRPASAAPAVGSHLWHVDQQKVLIEKALTST